MITIVGLIIVFFSVIFGYILHHGNLAVLYQPVEILIIGGAAVGALVASSTPYILKGIGHELIGVIKGSGVTKEKYIQLILLFNELFRMATSNPVSVEPHVENPDSSALFQKYPLILKDHHAVDFICNTMLTQLSAPMSPYDLEDLLDQDIEVMHHEEKVVPASMGRFSDALPGLGIVAAVLGIVITMGKLDQGKEAIGQSVAAALVGTFLGILMCYGIFQPISAKVESNIEEKGKILLAIKAGLIAYAKGAKAPAIVEFTRRNIPLEFRPSMKEVEEAIKGKAA